MPPSNTSGSSTESGTRRPRSTRGLCLRGASACCCSGSRRPSSLAAHLYANRLQYLVGSYLAAARNLDALRVGWQTFGSADDAGERHRFILDCEAVLSSENQSWITEWARKDGGQK